MELSKITIENFKSIEKIEFNIKKYDNSYTTMLLGINESGKSNILEAMSYLRKPQEKFDYDEISNQKNETSDDIDIYFYFENIDMYLNKMIKTIKGGELLNVKLTNLYKDIYLGKNRTTFSEIIMYTISELTKNLFIKKISKNNLAIAKQNDEENSYVKLTEKVFKEYFADKIKEIIKTHEPSVSFWKPSEKYLISKVDLKTFKEDTSSNIPLKNIFSLSNIKTEEKIKEEINKISNRQLRRKLMSKLSKETTKYITNIWKHAINIDIEINENGICNVSIRDDGTSNEHNYHKMNTRSDGFKQFISLILSLSIEAKESVKNSMLILIDEPEIHLHPSGIRDLGKELLEIGKNNYLFVATHSPFLIDKTNKERNIIIKKNNNALT